MDISASMLEYALAKKGLEVVLKGDTDTAITRVRPYRPGAREQGVAYVASISTPLPRTSARSGNVVLCIEGEQAEAMAYAYDALRELDAWDASLKEALLHGASLQDFIDLGREMLGCPLCYFDRNLIALAASDDYWESGPTKGTSDRQLQVEGQMPPSRAADLVEDLDYLHAAERQGGFYYESSQHRRFFGVNTFDQGDYLARLVLALPEGMHRLQPGQEQLVEHFHTLLDQLHLRYAGNAGVVSSQNDALHALVRRALLDASDTPQPAEDDAASILASFGWALADNFVLARIVFFEGLHWDTVSLYLCGLLERAMTGSCAFPAGQQIVWLVNLTRAARSGETQGEAMQRFTESLVSILRTYACKSGISSAFSDFTLAHSAYREAIFALEIGPTRDPHYWYFRFKDYALDYLLAKCGEDLPPTQVCHPALEVLIAHDAEHGTEYARTLVCYLRNSQNTTHAASELFIHRTSFMRRMNAIADMTSIDLGDSDQVLHLLLSAKLLAL